MVEVFFPQFPFPHQKLMEIAEIYKVSFLASYMMRLFITCLHDAIIQIDYKLLKTAVIGKLFHFYVRNQSVT